MIKDIDIVADFSHLYSNPSSAVALQWKQLFSDGRFTQNVLWDYWYEKVPAAYSAHSNGDVRIFDSYEPASVLIEELQQFVYNGASEPINEFIRSNGGCDQFCGRVLKSGEPSYSCRDCGSDSTSVLCVECFQRSPHQEHQYRMATSYGGGFCDCGDTEAWTNYPHCDAHNPSVNQQHQIHLPLDFYLRCKAVFDFALSFVVEVMHKNFKSINKTSETNEQHLLTMYNDEVHSFNQVIDILIKVISCSPKEALAFAAKINRDGRAVIALSQHKRLTKSKSTIEHLSATDGINPLEVHILPFSVVACQQFASHLLHWIQTLVKVNVDFRSALVEVLQRNADSRSLLDQILLQDPTLWKSSKIQWHSLICSGMLVEQTFKKTLAVRFVKNYGQIMENHANDEDGLKYSTPCLSVQLYTVPSIALELIEVHGAFKTAVDFVIGVTSPYVNSEGTYEFGHAGSYVLDRASCPLQDVRYLLGCVQPCSLQSIRGVVDGMSSLLTVLGYAQGMNSVTRQLGAHVEYEPEWETSYKLLTILSPIVTLVEEWCSVDSRILSEVYKLLLSKIDTLKMPKRLQKCTFGNVEAECITFNVINDPVSLHLPLTRLWGDLYVLREPQNLPNCSIIDVIEPVLRTRLMLAQFRAGMWKKNGNSLTGSVFYYHSPKFRAQMMEKDVIVLQIGASFLDSESFMINLLSKFELLNWTHNGLKSNIPEVDLYQMNILIDEFLHMIIVIVSERYSVVGDVAASDCLLNAIVHKLAIKPASQSELVKLISKKEKEDFVESVAKECARFKVSDTLTKKGLFHMTEEYPKSYNVFHFHYTKEESFKSEQRLKLLYKNCYGAECCPPPVLPQFSTRFVKILNLLKSDVLLQIVNLVLNRWISSNGGTEHDGHVHKSLFLIGLALREEASNCSFDCLVKLKNWNIDSLMIHILRDNLLKEHKDLLKWTLRMYANLAQDSDLLDILSFQDEVTVESNEETRKKELAAKARADIMVRMKAMQLQFRERNTQSFVDANVPEASVLRTKSVTCILCQEDELLEESGRVMILASFVQNSNVHCTQKSMSRIHVSTCGHIMHAECWDSWNKESIRKRNNGEFPMPFSHNLDNEEYLCPLCQSIGNSAVPMISGSLFQTRSSHECPQSGLSFSEWIRLMVAYLFPSKVHESKLTGTPNDTPEQSPIPLCTITYHDKTWSVKIPNDIQNFPSMNNEQCNSIRWIRRLSDTINEVSKGKFKDRHDTNALCDAVAYTIQSTERCLHRHQKPLFGGMKSREEDGVTNLIHVVFKMEQSNTELLSSVLSDDPFRMSSLSRNCFPILVNLLSSRFQMGHKESCSPGTCRVEGFLCRLLLIRQIAQLLVSMPELEERSQEDKAENTQCLLALTNTIRHQNLVFNTDNLWEILKTELVPFLRCCALFFRYSNRDTSQCSLENVGHDTYGNLCKYLQLPVYCSELLDNEETQAMFAIWSTHPYTCSPIWKYVGTNRLVHLPDDYCQILNALWSFRCPNSDIDDSPNPTMCLICGEVLCSLSYCCQMEINGQKVGACTFHTQECCEGTGIFLRLRECRLMLFAGFGRGCFSTPPYLDKHGESDEGLRRGNPLHLCKKSYANLEALWWSHGIYEKVARSIDATGLHVTRWQFL